MNEGNSYQFYARIVCNHRYCERAIHHDSHGACLRLVCACASHVIRNERNWVTDSTQNSLSLISYRYSVSPETSKKFRLSQRSNSYWGHPHTKLKIVGNVFPVACRCLVTCINDRTNSIGQVERNYQPQHFEFTIVIVYCKK